MEKKVEPPLGFSLKNILDKLDKNPNMPGCLTDPQDLNILGKILPDLQKNRTHFESFPYGEIGPLKAQALTATNTLREETFLPFFGNGKVKKKKETKKDQEIRQKKTTRIIEKNYPTFKEMMAAYFKVGNTQIYDPAIIYKSLFLMCYHYALKQHSFNKAYAKPSIQYKNTNEKLVETLVPTNNIFSTSTDDITSDQKEYEIYMGFVQQLLNIGQSEGDTKLLKKLLEQSSRSFRAKSIVSAVKKFFKGNTYLDLLVHHGSIGDMNGMKVGFYNLEQAKIPLQQFITILHGSDKYDVKKMQDRGLMGSFVGTEGKINQDTSQDLFPELNITVGDALGKPLIEIQFGLHPKVMYDAILQKLIANKQVEFITDHKHKTVKISYKSAENFRMFLLKYVNDIQHEVYKIQNNRRFAHKLIPNTYFADNHRAYSGSQAFLHGQFESARLYTTEKLQKDLNETHTIREYLLKHSLENVKQYAEQGYTITFPDFTKTSKTIFHTCIFSALHQELQEQYNRKIQEGKGLSEEDELLLKLTSTVKGKSINTQGDIYSILSQTPRKG